MDEAEFKRGLAEINRELAAAGLSVPNIQITEFRIDEKDRTHLGLRGMNASGEAISAEFRIDSIGVPGMSIAYEKLATTDRIVGTFILARASRYFTILIYGQQVPGILQQ